MQYSTPSSLVDAGGWQGAPADAADSPPTPATGSFWQAPAAATHANIYKATLSLESSRVPTGWRIYYNLDKDVIGGDTLETRVQIVDGLGQALITPRVITVVSATSGYLQLTEAEALAIAARDTRQVWLSSQAVSSPVLTHGQPYTLVGAGFGTKASASPIFWDSCRGPLGASPTVSTPGYQSVVGTYSSTVTRGGAATSWKLGDYYTGASPAPAELYFGEDLQEAYVSAWVYVRKVSGATSRNIKVMRMCPSSTHTDKTHVGITLLYESPFWFLNDGINRYRIDWVYSDWSPWGAGWVRVEYYWKKSTIDVADGVLGWWQNGQRLFGLNGGGEADYEAFRSYWTDPALVYDHVDRVLLGFYVAHDPGGDYEIYHDNIYVDRTRQRVELSTSAVWTDTSPMAREVQPVTAWSSSSITFTGNIGALGTGTRYLYVVRADGSRVSDLGTPVTVA